MTDSSVDNASGSVDGLYSQEYVDDFSEVQNSFMIVARLNAIDAVYQKLASSSSSGDRYIVDVRHLRRLCRSTSHVPASCKTARGLVLVFDKPILKPVFSDVYRRTMGEQEVGTRISLPQ
jgi:hypothetical protein